MEKAPLLEMKDIHLYYGDVHALRGVDFTLFPGEIHALVGEHRAGKSSLVKILSGALKKRSGRIVYRGKSIDFFTLNSALKNEIGMIYEEPLVVNSFSTLEYIFFMRSSSIRGKKLYRKVSRLKRELEIQSLCEKYNFKLKFNREIRENTLDEQNIIEFISVILLNPQILILDELSNRFNPDEMEKIYSVLFDMRERGKSIIYISHNMDEVKYIADRVTVMNQGVNRVTETVDNLDEMQLIKMTYAFFRSREALVKENLELNNLKKYNEDVLRNIPIGVVILTEKDKVFFINDASYTIFMLEKCDHTGELIQNILNEVQFMDNSQREILMDQIHNQAYFILEEIHLKNEIVKIIIIPFRDERKTFLGTILLIEDITNELNLMNYLLRAEKVTSIAELAAGVAHEINNPLWIVQNCIDLLAVSPMDKNQTNNLSKIEKEILRISDIVKNLLSFSKSMNVKFKVVNIERLIGDVVVLLEHKLKENNTSIEYDFRAGKPLCIGDENSLKQLFINLIINSIESKKGSVRISIQLDAEPEDNILNISVCDNGPGISEDIIQDIFGPFFTTKEESKNAGLGLSICHHIVNLHGGTITCESEVNKYTCFHIRLPLSNDS